MFPIVRDTDIYFICIQYVIWVTVEIFLVIFYFLFWLFLYIFLNYLLRIDDSRCNKPCPSGAGAESSVELCGGDWALTVYFTGVRLVRTNREPIPATNIRIAFIMTIYGQIIS